MHVDGFRVVRGILRARGGSSQDIVVDRWGTMYSPRTRR